jgi:sugar phosphate isomerase/epimerase
MKAKCAIMTSMDAYEDGDTLMQFSCHTWSFPDLTLAESLATIARMGFRYVDIGSGHGWNVVRAANPATRKEAIAELQSDLALFNLKVADFYLMLPRISLNDEKQRTTDLQLFKALMPFMQAMQARGITVSSGVVHGEDDPEAQDRTVASLREMVKMAQAIDVPISIEPHVDSMAQTAEQTLKLIKQVPGLQITLDWAQIIYHKGIKQSDAYELLPHTRHVHVRQANTGRLQTNHDKGKLDLAEMMQALRDAEYAGMVTVELMGANERHGAKALNPVPEVIALRDALRDLRDTEPIA